MIRTLAAASAIAALCASAAMALPNNSGKKGTYTGGSGLSETPKTGGHGGHGIANTPIHKLPCRNNCK